MKKRRFTEEQMVTILREADRTTVAEASKKYQVTVLSQRDKLAAQEEPL